MNKDNAKDYLPLVQAMAEGKAIEGYFELDEKWMQLVEVRFDAPASQYRIKPEPREVFIPRWPDGFEGASYDSEEEARKAVSVDTKCKIIRYREVVE